MVQVGSDDLRRYDQCLAAGSAALEQVLREIDTDERGTASHTGKVVAQDISPKTEFGYHHGAERRRRREQRAVDDQNIDLLGPDVGLAQGILHNVKDHGLGLLPARLHGSVGLLAILEALDDARRPGGGLAGAGPLQETLHEIEAVLGEASLPAHHFDDLRLRHLPAIGRLEGGKGEEVDGIVHPEEPGHHHKHDCGGFDGGGEERLLPNVEDLIDDAEEQILDGREDEDDGVQRKQNVGNSGIAAGLVHNVYHDLPNYQPNQNEHAHRQEEGQVRAEHMRPVDHPARQSPRDGVGMDEERREEGEHIIVGMLCIV